MLTSKIVITIYMYYFKLYKYLTNTYNINVIECMEPIYENIYMHAFVRVWYQQRHGFYYSYWIFRYEKSFSVLDSQTTDWRRQSKTSTTINGFLETVDYM